MQNEELHIAEGESIQLPVSLQGLDLPLKRYQVSLVRCLDGKVIENLFECIALVPAAGQLYHNMLLKSLEPGQHTLHLKLSIVHFKKITITVHKGRYWTESGGGTEFILKNNCLLSSATSDQGLMIESVAPLEPNKATNETCLKLALSNFTEDSRVHVFATQFVPND